MDEPDQMADLILIDPRLYAKSIMGSFNLNDIKKFIKNKKTNIIVIKCLKVILNKPLCSNYKFIFYYKFSHHFYIVFINEDSKNININKLMILCMAR